MYYRLQFDYNLIYDFSSILIQRLIKKVLISFFSLGARSTDVEECSITLSGKFRVEMFKQHKNTNTFRNCA